MNNVCNTLFSLSSLIISTQPEEGLGSVHVPVNMRIAVGSLIARPHTHCIASEPLDVKAYKGARQCMDRFARSFVQDHSSSLQKRAADMMDSFNIT